MEQRNANKRNYQQEMEKLWKEIPEGTTLVLHSCCGPCSSSVLEQLAGHFSVTLLYYNPNIWPPKEYKRRKEEQEDVVQKLQVKYPITFVELPYIEEEFYSAVKGLEKEKEGGARCEKCFELRLAQGAKFAKQNKIEWYTTTLTVSPHKNSQLLNQIGESEAQKAGVRFLSSDFKKKNGYKRSLEISQELNLYRQEYCGCVYSYQERFSDENDENKV